MLKVNNYIYKLAIINNTTNINIILIHLINLCSINTILYNNFRNFIHILATINLLIYGNIFDRTLIKVTILFNRCGNLFMTNSLFISFVFFRLSAD